MTRKNEPKTMENKQGADVVCSKCGALIIPANIAEGMRQRTIDEYVVAHHCKKK